MMSGRSGRRPGESGTRAAILAAAARQFAERGFARATLRSIAAEAGVDAALISHYFGSKPGLFAAVAQPPVDPAAIVTAIASGPAEGIGERLARLMIGAFEDEKQRQRLAALMRAGVTEPDVGMMLRQVIAARLVPLVTSAIRTDHGPLRANLVASQMIGLLIARYILRVEPIASLTPEAVVAVVAPTLQRYLAAPLDLGTGAHPGADQESTGDLE